MTENHAPLHMDRRGAVGWLVFNRPHKRNAITYEMWRQIPHMVAELDADPEVRIIALRGAGSEAFSAGADIGEFAEVRAGADAGRHYDAANDAAFRAVAMAKKPTLAMISGHCLGGGLALAINCDLRIAAENASFAIPAARLGVGYAPQWVGTLVAIAGAGHAKEILFTARTYHARQALELGLVHHAVPDSDLEAVTEGVIGAISANAPLTIRAVKAAIDAYAVGHPDNLAALQDLAEICYDSEDFAEGRAAFMEKRKPQFEGK